MQSDGGLTPVAQFNGCRAILSGPAGGVVGYATTAYSAEDGRGVIGFDMGGTSTDVSRYAGSYEHLFESTTAGYGCRVRACWYSSLRFGIRRLLGREQTSLVALQPFSVYCAVSHTCTGTSFRDRICPFLILLVKLDLTM